MKYVQLRVRKKRFLILLAQKGLLRKLLQIETLGFAEVQEEMFCLISQFVVLMQQSTSNIIINTGRTNRGHHFFQSIF